LLELFVEVVHSNKRSAKQKAGKVILHPAFTDSLNTSTKSGWISCFAQRHHPSLPPRPGEGTLRLPPLEVRRIRQFHVNTVVNRLSGQNAAGRFTNY